VIKELEDSSEILRVRHPFFYIMFFLLNTPSQHTNTYMYERNRTTSHTFTLGTFSLHAAIAKMGRNPTTGVRRPRL
jgi:hypothetical protein